MDVSSTRIAESPETKNRIRYSVTVTYDDRPNAPEVYWHDFPDHLADCLAPSGNPWLALLLPIAAQLGEPIRIPEPIDPQLLEGAYNILRTWKSWERKLHIVPIEAPILPRRQQTRGDRVGCFFSGGVDSMFSVLHHDAHADYLPPVNDLITVWGFDIPVDRQDAIAKTSQRLDEVAAEMGKDRINVWTNVRKNRLKDWDWGRYTHGGAMMSVGLSLESRFWRILAPSSYATRNMYPWGTHAVTDPWFSTQRTEFVYDGGAFGRIEKIGMLSTQPIALRNVRSCWKTESADNCSKCGKCTRTMLGFAAHGVLGQLTAFDTSQFSLEKVVQQRASDEQDIENFKIMYECLPSQADAALRAALGTCIERNTKYYQRLRKFEQLEMTPWLGWLFGYYKRAFVAAR